MKHQKAILCATLCMIVAIVFNTVIMHDTYAEHSLNLTVSSEQIIDVSPGGTGTAISESSINITTTCQAGYDLFLSSTVNDNNLYLNGDTNNNTPGQYLSPSDGNTSLISANNTWGYYLSDSYGEAPTINNTFLPVPTSDNPITLKSSSQTASTSAIDDDLSIYYGIKISNNLTSGIYTMTKDEDDRTGALKYYATLSENCFKYTIEYNPTGTNMGSSITGTGNVESQSAAEGVSINLTNDTFGNPVVDGVTYYFIGWNTSQDGTGISYASGESVTDLAPTGTTITLYAQWTDCPSENICYYKNHSDATGAMEHQSTSSNSSTTLLAPNYSLSDYGFIGWSEDKNAAVKLINDETVLIHGPNETILTGDLSTAGMQLYAVWLAPVGTLQDWNGCGELQVGDTVALQDSRDHNAYGVAKLSDGRCWMIENLRLESGDSRGVKASLAQGYDASFTGLADVENINFYDSTVANSLYSTNGSTVNTIGGDYIGSRFPRYNNVNTSSGNSQVNDSDADIYEYGNYYTWAAVVADTSLHSDLNSFVSTTSICPEGWRVPKGGNKDVEASNDYWSLIVDGINNGIKPENYSSFARPYYYGTTEGTLVSEALRRYPNNFIQSGYYSESSALDRGNIGGYWTSVTSINNGSYTLNIESSRVDPGTSFSNKYTGNTVRCLYERN